MPIILGSVLIFAIDTAIVNAKETSSIEYNITQTDATGSIVHLEEDEFWSKFRESVMKDKDKNKNDPDRPNDNNRDEPPPSNIQSN